MGSLPWVIKPRLQREHRLVPGAANRVRPSIHKKATGVQIVEKGVLCRNICAVIEYFKELVVGPHQTNGRTVGEAFSAL